MELSFMCKLDVIVFVRDIEFNKITYYNSTSDSQDQLTMDQAINLINGKISDYKNLANIHCSTP